MQGLYLLFKSGKNPDLLWLMYRKGAPSLKSNEKSAPKSAIFVADFRLSLGRFRKLSMDISIWLLIE